MKISDHSEKYTLVDGMPYVKTVLDPVLRVVVWKKMLENGLVGLSISSLSSGMLLLCIPNNISTLFRMDVSNSILFYISLTTFLASVIIIIFFIATLAILNHGMSNILDDSVKSAIAIRDKIMASLKEASEDNKQE